jgi:hypothetical protein
MEEVNLTKIYCKHICKYHKVSPVQLLYANKIVKKKLLCDMVEMPNLPNQTLC